MPAKKKTPGASTARFAKVVAECGTPQVVLLWGEPSKAFLDAYAQDRVMTVLQTTTGQTKDSGVVGFKPSKNATYLLFPKPLTQFKAAKVVGIKYDLVDTGAQAGTFVETPKTPAPREAKELSTELRSLKTDAETAVGAPPAPPPPPPEKKRKYQVTFKFVAEVTLSQLVESISRKEARRLAEAQTDVPDFSGAAVERRTVGVKLLAQ